MTNNFDSKEVLWMADYADWDMDEIRTMLPRIFPNANDITIDSIEPDTMYVIVDGESYAITPDGEIVNEED